MTRSMEAQAVKGEKPKSIEPRRPFKDTPLRELLRIMHCDLGGISDGARYDAWDELARRRSPKAILLKLILGL